MYYYKNTIGQSANQTTVKKLIDNLGNLLQKINLNLIELELDEDTNSTNINN